MTTQEKERPPLASFAMRSGEDASSPGFMQEGEHSTSEERGNYTVEQMAFKSYAKVWDNRTGAMSYQPRNLLWQTFQLKRPEDGSFIFTDRDPHIPQNYGLDLLCYLHPDNHDFPELKAMGFRECRKHHTPTQAARDSHMAHTHKRAYTSMLGVLEQRRRDQDRELQLEVIRSNQTLIRALAGNVSGEAKPTRRRKRNT